MKQASMGKERFCVQIPPWRPPAGEKGDEDEDGRRLPPYFRHYLQFLPQLEIDGGGGDGQRARKKVHSSTLLTWTTGEEEEEEEEATLVFSLRRDVRGLGTAVVKCVDVVECRN